MSDDIEYLQKRLSALNEGRLTSWNLRDRSVVSRLIFELDDRDARIARLEGLLRKAEWQADDGELYCVICKQRPHASDCELVVALKGNS